MRGMKRRVLWGSFRPAPRERWTVYLVPPRHREIGKDLGRAYFGRRQIFVSWGQTLANVLSTFCHELDHVRIHPAGLPGSWEEQLVTAIEPRGLMAFLSFGVKFPTIPKAVLRRMKRDPRERKALAALVA
jgi:hypothetical protein